MTYCMKKEDSYMTIIGKKIYERERIMKVFIEKEKVLQIDEETKLILLNVDEFVSTIKRESSITPAGHIKIGLKYKLIYNNSEYDGESIFDSFKDIINNMDANSPYEVELINWKLSDKEEKYLEFNIKRKVKDYPILSYGTFVDISNDNELKKYAINEDENDKIKNSKREAFNWIKNCKNYDIKKIENSYSNAGYHDEEGSSNTIEKTVDDGFDNLAKILFYCKKDNEDFVLKPTFKVIINNNIKYIIPEIEIYHYEPEKIGLINLDKIK